MKENKDEALTYEELTARCRKQEEYIKELEEKLKTSSETVQCGLDKPTYDELCRQVRSLTGKSIELEQENDALRWSLTKMYIQLEISKVTEEQREEDYYRENSRAAELYDKLNKGRN